MLVESERPRTRSVTREAKSKKELDPDGGSSAIHPELIAGCSHEWRRR
jgi:hypothetical protein